ncbi:hypothetical protein B0H15DRAFT_336936 [Mycena belliarum]|uniref:Uncharacterized protein n=1 Tax=Mycena belliarum TaxID=1033014 RepID=A0AAD6UNE8_9AGAR|nr:hypothetical protein B0H15DRAFT_336936 [Mycena belliae]
MRCLWLAFVLSLYQLASATVVVIDDVNGDPTNGLKIAYTPIDAWGANTIAGCNECPGPEPDQAYLGTWHGSVNGNSRHSPKATIGFTGTSVSVQCILSNSLQNPTGTSDMIFSIDGEQVGRFSQPPTGAPGFLPNRTVFISKTLLLEAHTLVIQNGRFDDGIASLLMLDSVTYTVEDNAAALATLSSPAGTSSSTTSPSSAVKTGSHTNVAAIVGAIFAVLAVLLLLGLAFLYIRHRRNQLHRSNVPLSTSLSAPLGRIRSLWPASPRPPPVMAPVPFPSPAQPRISPPQPSPPTSPRPRPPPPASSAPSESRFSRLSFNPNLLVGRRFQRRAPPAPISTLRPPAPPPLSPAPHSGNPLLRPHAPPQPSPGPSPQAQNFASIQEWQLRTLQEAAAQPPMHPLEMSEVDLSSHYDESSSGAPPPPPPVPVPAPSPRRCFTVMNN